MIRLSVSGLAASLLEAEEFIPPNMNEGTSYLYKAVYLPMTKGLDVRLSELDYTAFEQVDVEELNELYSDVFEKNGYKATAIASKMREAVPVCKSVGYV